MKTQIESRSENFEAMMQIAEQCFGQPVRRPGKFVECMKKNRGQIVQYDYYETPEDGMPRRNPLIVALGDSVTAGHFEFNGSKNELFEKHRKGLLGEFDAVEVTDVRECYLEKFREMLIEKYEMTSVSVVNAGISGDTLIGMKRRLHRDVICHQPDLVIINGALNWPPECGSTEVYENVLREIVRKIKLETEADIILMTPNDEVQMQNAVNVVSSLESRALTIRKIADEEKVCLADVYRVWKIYEKRGYPAEDMLANGLNHPTKQGHEICAEILMQLLRE